MYIQNGLTTTLSHEARIIYHHSFYIRSVTMCGIAGFINHQLSTDSKKDLNHKMLRSITHRGPEASNVWVEGAISLGHNRLKIIDLSDEANQPFAYQDVVVTFNGEIYNYIELRADLQQKGFQFRTSGDTEVICAAYKHYGEACVTHFVGMWAFALWDKTANKLFCSRDRFGIKPFYFIEQGKDFYFASEYKALKHSPAFDGTLNIEQLNRGLQLGWSSYYDETFFEKVKGLQPAHNLVWLNGKISINRYWDIDFSEAKSTLSFNEKKEQFFNLFETSVKLHARSDVPNGTCLSGGLDSSAISSMYSRLLPDSNIKSFTIYYDGENEVDERPFVHKVIEKYPNIIPYFYTPTTAEIETDFHSIAYQSDTPVLGSAYISHYFLMKLAKQEGVTVVIDGQGSDEYLGGYLHSFYRIIGGYFSSLNVMKGCSMLGNLSEREHFSSQKKMSFLLKSIASALHTEEGLYNLEYSNINKLLKNNAKPLHFSNVTTNKFDNFLYHLLLNTTLQTLLHFEDRNSMAFSLESRVPFLDHRLAEFAFTMLREDRITDRAETKYILRESLQPILPKAVYERKDKKGFVTPGEVKWLNGPLKHLLEIDYSRFDWMKADAVKKLVDDYKKGDTSKAALVWRIAATNYWLKHFA